MSEFFWSMMLVDFESNRTVMNRESKRAIEDKFWMPLEMITKNLIEPQGKVVGSRAIRFENKSITE